MGDERRTLDDPDYAAFVWARYRRIMKWMTVAALLACAAAEYWLYRVLGELNFVTMSATFLGVFSTVMLGAALMGLMFLSSGTGHDDEVEDRLKGEVDLD
jgi:hypothetical protein